MLGKNSLCFPSKNTLVKVKQQFYSTIHRTCFLTFKFIVRLIHYSVEIFPSIPSATLWYFQLVLSLSNDISENPGPMYTNYVCEGSPYFSFCNWNLNILSKDEFSRVSLLHAHNSIHIYDIMRKRVLLVF